MREFLLFGKGFTKVDQWQEGCWINVSDPNQDDFTYLEEMGVPESFISDIRDPNERPRVEKDDDWMLTIMRIPRETGDVDIPFSTVPLGVITNGDLVIVLCYFKNIVIHDFIQYNTAKGNAINNKFALILRSVTYTHLRAHETGRNLVCRLLLEKKQDEEEKKTKNKNATQ